MTENERDAHTCAGEADDGNSETAQVRRIFQIIHGQTDSDLASTGTPAPNRVKHVNEQEK